MYFLIFAFPQIERWYQGYTLPVAIYHIFARKIETESLDRGGEEFGAIQLQGEN